MQRQQPRTADLKKAACWCFGFSAAAVLTRCRVLCRDRRGESSVQNWQKKKESTHRCWSSSFAWPPAVVTLNYAKQTASVRNGREKPPPVAGIAASGAAAAVRREFTAGPAQNGKVSGTSPAQAHPRITEKLKE